MIPGALTYPGPTTLPGALPAINYPGGRWQAEITPSRWDAIAGAATMARTVTIQHETHDFLPVALTFGGDPYTGAWSYQIVPTGARPTVGGYIAAVTSGGVKGIDITGLQARPYWCFIRIDGVSPYLPVLDPLVIYMQ